MTKPREEPPPPVPHEVEERAEKVDYHAEALVRQPRTLKDLVRSEEFLKAVSDVAPRVMRPSRFIRAVLTSMMRVPLLAECTRESFFKAMLDCAFYGIEPDGRRAHLIPFRNRKTQPPTVECQLILDYKGLCELVRRSGDVSYIHADAVYEHDEWECSFGTGAKLVHKPNLEDRGTKRRCFYSFVRLKDGSEDFMVMNLTEIEKVRKRSKSPDEGPWVTDFDEMAKKTVFRRHSKWLPLSPESRFNLDRSDPEAVEVGNTWTEMLNEAPEPTPQRLTAREKILGPVTAHDGSGAAGDPKEAVCSTEPAPGAVPPTSKP
jgi:recombination protein RecT